MGGFNEWLATFVQVDSRIGDLARDAAVDPDWPDGGNDRQVYFDYLQEEVGLSFHAPAVRSLELAWEAYGRRRR